MAKCVFIGLLISLGLVATSLSAKMNTLAYGYGCDPKVCSDICGSTGVDDFTAYSCNPFTCKCYCSNPPPPNCIPDRDGRCDNYCKQTYCHGYFGILCGSYNNPVCTCACDPYGGWLKNNMNASLSSGEVE